MYSTAAEPITSFPQWPYCQMCLKNIPEGYCKHFITPKEHRFISGEDDENDL